MSVVAWMVASLSLLSAGEAPPAEGGGAAEVEPKIAVHEMWTSPLYLREGGADRFEYPASELGGNAGPVVCDARVAIDAEGRLTAADGYPKGCPPAFVEATRAGLAALRFRRVDGGEPGTEGKGRIQVRYSLAPVPPAGSPLPDRYSRFHFPDSTPIAGGLPADCALRLHVGPTGEVLAAQPAPAGCPAALLPGALEDAYRMRFQPPPEAPREGWRFDLVVTYCAGERVLATQQRRALRLSQRPQALSLLDGPALGPRTVPEALPVGGRAHLFSVYPSRAPAGLDLDGAPTLSAPVILTRRPARHFEWPRGLVSSGETPDCLVHVWFDAEGRPVHVEPDPGWCAAGTAAAAVEGAWGLRFQPVRVDGEVLPVVRTTLHVAFRRD